MKYLLKKIGLIMLLIVAAQAFVIATGQTDSEASGTTVIKWFGSRGVPGTTAPIPGMLEKLISEKLGYPVEFEIYGTAESDMMPTVQLMLAADELPDIFPVTNMNEELLKQAVAKVDLAEMEEYMPESMKWGNDLIGALGMNKADTWKNYTDDDGMMWGIPRTWDMGCVPSGQMWRKDILDELGFDVPATIAEAEELFAAFKKAYPDQYCFTGSGKSPTWQCFDFVFSAFGIPNNGHGVIDGTLKMYFALPEFREALAVLKDWYDKGYIDPEFITQTNGDKFRLFAQGNYLVVDWISRNNWNFDETAKNIGQLVNNVPGAEAVAAPFVAKDSDTKPMQRVWNPFLSQLTVFSKDLADDHDHIHKIMQVYDLIAHDDETQLLALYGVEGEHYTIPEGETVPQLTSEVSALSVADRIDKYGFGFYWQTVSLYPTRNSSNIQDAIDTMFKDPDGIYGDKNLGLWMPTLTNVVRDENGEDIDAMINADTKLNYFVMAVKIITGIEPLEYYDEWLDYYYANGGTEWEKHATRMFVK